jgi:hypothetical protein
MKELERKMVQGLNKIFFLFGMLFQIGCSQKLIEGYYEPQEKVMDETINGIRVKIEDYNLIRQNFTVEQLGKINEIISDTTLHLSSDLGTCEISGLFVIDKKVIYSTCGTSQLFVCDKTGIETILLNEVGNRKLFELIQELRKKDTTDRQT